MLFSEISKPWSVISSNTETNPKAYVKFITTRSGKIINPLIPLTDIDSSNVQQPEEEIVQEKATAQQPRLGDHETTVWPLEEDKK